ncbi:MAG TPA: hypothetical protein VID29_03375 [Solirubrobacteraceae bacterium]
MTRGKILILLAMTACATALSVAPASAFFKASSGKYPVTITVSKNEPQKFKIGTSVELECSTIAVEGRLLGEGSQLTVRPTYSGCSGIITGTKVSTVKVKTNECLYNFHQAKGEKVGSVSVECPGSNFIFIETNVLECDIKIFSSPNLKEVTFENEGSGTTEEVKVEPKVSGIAFESAKCAGIIPVKGNNATYEGISLVLGLISNNGVSERTGILVV